MKIELRHLALVLSHSDSDSDCARLLMRKEVRDMKHREKVKQENDMNQSQKEHLVLFLTMADMSLVFLSKGATIKTRVQWPWSRADRERERRTLDGEMREREDSVEKRAKSFTQLNPPDSLHCVRLVSHLGL